MSTVNLALDRFKLNHKPDPVLRVPDPDFRSMMNPIRVTPPIGGGDYIIPNLTDIEDQGEIGSCAAHAGTGALEILLNNEGKLVLLSRLHLYGIARQLDGTYSEDAGTFLRSICQQAHKIGVCEESIWPYLNPSVNFKKPPPMEAAIRASENRIQGYYAITSTGAQRLYDITQAIHANHPVIFGTQVGRGFMTTDGVMPLVPDPTDMQGGHATCLVGVQSVAGRLCFRDKNSWGTSWGEDGYAWLDQDYMTWEHTGDIWVMTRMSPIQ